MLNEGINVDIYQSDYNQFYQESVFDNASLSEFDPQIIYIHTTNLNVSQWPTPSDSEAEVNLKIDEQFKYYHHMWRSLADKYDATVIQNNFEMPFVRPLGNPLA